MFIICLYTVFLSWLSLFASKQQNYIPFWLVKISRDTGKWLGTWNMVSQRWCFCFCPGIISFWGAIFPYCSIHFGVFFHIFFPDILGESLGKSSKKPCVFQIYVTLWSSNMENPWESLGWWSLKWSVPAWCLWRPGQTDPIFTKQICRIFTLSTETYPKN